MYKMQYDLEITECIYIKNLSSEGKSLMWCDTMGGENKSYGLEDMVDEIILFLLTFSI